MVYVKMLLPAKVCHRRIFCYRFRKESTLKSFYVVLLTSLNLILNASLYRISCNLVNISNRNDQVLRIKILRELVNSYWYMAVPSLFLQQKSMIWQFFNKLNYSKLLVQHANRMFTSERQGLSICLQMGFLFSLMIVLSTFQLYVQKSEAELQRRNVVFIIIDDLRPAISGYGDPLAKTPNIDKFMQKSFYFTRAYCQQALCAPSRNSMLTGRRPDSLHLYDFYSYWRTFAGNFTTLPQYFKANGYHTYSIGKVFHPGVSSNFTDDFPFSWSQTSFHPITEVYMNAPVCPDQSGKLKANLVCPVNVKSQPGRTLPDIESVREGKRFLHERGNSTEPFFLAVGLHKPHVPFRFPNKFLRLFPREKFNISNYHKPEKMPNVAWNPYMDVRKRDDSKRQHIPFPFGPIPQDFQVSVRQAYYASVGYADHLFGKLLEDINLNNTVVVVTGDHGWSLGEHSEWAKFSNFEVAVRVPLIIYSPEFKVVQGTKIENIVELVDIFSTLVDLARLPRVEKCKHQQDLICTQGHSLIDLIKTRNSSGHNIALSQYPRPGEYPTEHPNSDEPKLHQIKIMGYSIRTNNFRYTLWVEFNVTNFTRDWEKIYGEELYDHRVDPAEDNNLTESFPYKEIRTKLRYRLIRKFSNV